MTSDHVRGTLERRTSAELLELRRQGVLSDSVGALVEEILRERGVDPAASPAVPTPVRGGVTGDPLVVARRVRGVAWFQIVVAAFLLWFGVVVLVDLTGRVSDLAAALSVVVVALVVGLNAAAGTLTLRGRRAGYWLSVWNHVAQIPVLAVPGFFYHYAGLGGLIVRVTSAPGVFIDARLDPGIFFQIGEVPTPYFIGVDFLAVGIVGLLLSALQLQPVDAND